MTIAHARKISVDGVDYRWALKNAGQKCKSKGGTPSKFKLIIENAETRKVSTFTFCSKLWTEDENGEVWAKDHKVEFTPSIVATVIRAFASGKDIPEFESWRLEA